MKRMGWVLHMAEMMVCLAPGRLAAYSIQYFANKLMWIKALSGLPFAGESIA
jgi:predicted patatin/cPLA2 family phospholipase